MNWRRAAFLAVLLSAFVPVQSWASAAALYGASCTTAGANNTSAADATGNNLICDSGTLTWKYPEYTLQSAAAAAGSSCSGIAAGTLRYNTTLTNVEMCNGTNWLFLAASTTACGSPSGLAFTNLTSQAVSTSVSTILNPATITFSGCPGGQSVSVSGTASAQISINGGTWGTSGSITSGQTLNVRMVTSGSASTTLTATVTVGSSTTNWTTTTRAAALMVFETTGAYIATAIGGLSGADAICQSEATSAGFVGTYKAIMSDATTSAASRLTLSYPIVNASGGATVSSLNLWNGVLSTTILNKNGSLSGSGSPNMWTGTTSTGGISSGGTCSSWSAGGTNGENGWDRQTNTQWIDCCANFISCGSPGSIFCIQQ